MIEIQSRVEEIISNITCQCLLLIIIFLPFFLLIIYQNLTQAIVGEQQAFVRVRMMRKNSLKFAYFHLPDRQSSNFRSLQEII